MIRRLAYPMAVLAGLLVAGSVFAGEVVQFTEFRHLMIESHEVEGDFIRARFESGGVILLPAFRVDMIKRGDRIVYDRRPAAVDTAGPAARGGMPAVDLVTAPEEDPGTAREPARIAGLPPRP